MKKLLVITPHLSTGGAPQVTVNKLALLKNEYEILCVEYRRISWDYNVQRNRLLEIIGDGNFISLDDDKKTHLKQIIDSFNPDVISMEEFPEFFMDRESSELIYSPNRNYRILETTHDSSFKPKDKKFFPDKFVFVSAYNAFKYSLFNIPYDIVEYPVEYKEKNKLQKQKHLNLDTSWKHVVNVGLFTPRKNQAYIFELAEKLKNYRIKFHFLGNQAPNFEYYWKPLMDSNPENCLVWGERSDVTDFLEASDLFLFTSRGDKHNKELNPIAIKEALEFKIPMLMHNLDVYCGKYNNFENISFLTGDLELDTKKILEILDMKNQIDVENTIETRFDENTNSIHFTNKNSFSLDMKVSIKCLTSKAPIYWVNFKPYPFGGWFATPIPAHVLKFKGNANFRGFLLEFYDTSNNLLGSKEIVVNDIYPILTEVDFLPFDCSYRNYIEFFKDDIYGSFNLNDLDTVLDVGSNIGLFAKYMYGKNAKKVILVEANPLLDENIKTVMGKDYDKESTYLTPLFRDKRTVTYKYSSNNSTIGTVVFDENPHDYRDLDSELKIETVTFDEIVTKHNLKRISLFKCDIEGGEYDLIESLTDKQMNMVDRFMIEFHENQNGELKRLIEKLDRFGFESKLYKLEMIYKKIVDESEGHGVLITNKRDESENKSNNPKIKIVHLQTTNNLEKEQVSRESLQPLVNYGFEYALHQNIPFASLPPSHNSLRPSCVSKSLFDGAVSERGETALTPAHYGCFESFKNGILSEFSDDLDFLMVCEGDCLIEIPHEEFVKTVYDACKIIQKENIEYFSFGDTHTLDSNNWLQSTEIYLPQNQNLLFVTNKIIGLQCILFPKSVKTFLFDRLLNEKWDAADVYFNHIFNWGEKKMGILKNRVTTQVDGFSLLDKEIKIFRK